MKNNKGFTLIELMIAIAIIGILALVLIPRIGGMKSQARLAGIDTNLRVATGSIEGLINEFDASSPTVLADLETAIASRLAAGGADKAIKNPITSATGVVGYDATHPSNGDVAFTYTVDNTTAKLADNASINNANMKGVIYYQAYLDSGDLKVDLIPYDDNGNVMTQKIKTIAK